VLWHKLQTITDITIHFKESKHMTFFCRAPRWCVLIVLLHTSSPEVESSERIFVEERIAGLAVRPEF
jgi:hypothetical protein